MHDMRADLKRIAARLAAAECPSDEVAKMIAERRDLNAQAGGDDATFVLLTAYFATRFQLPVRFDPEEAA